MAVVISKQYRGFYAGIVISILILLFIVYWVQSVNYDTVTIQHIASQINTAINNHSKQSNQSNGCDWNPPFSRLNKYNRLDVRFKKIKFNETRIIEYIHNKSRSIHCTQTDNVYIYNFSKNNPSKLNIAIATIIILTNSLKNRGISHHGINMFTDIRTYLLKLANALYYCQIHGYSLIILFKPIFEYKYNHNQTYDKNKTVNHAERKIMYEKNMNLPTNQKPFLVHQYLSSYDWILWTDYDTMFLHCYLKIEDAIINHAYSIHANHTNSNLISIIFGAEWYSSINAGVWLIKNNEWSDNFLSNWMFIEKNAEQFELLKIHNFQQDQTIFVALLEGFRFNQYISKPAWREIELKRDSASRWYIKKHLNVDVEYVYKYPIYDTNLSKYAVAINETILNGKINFKFDTQTLIMHYYSKDKTEIMSVMQTFRCVCGPFHFLHC